MVTWNARYSTCRAPPFPVHPCRPSFPTLSSICSFYGTLLALPSLPFTLRSSQRASYLSPGLLSSHPSPFLLPPPLCSIPVPSATTFPCQPQERNSVLRPPPPPTMFLRQPQMRNLPWKCS